MLLGIEGGGTQTRIASRDASGAAQFKVYDTSIKFRDIGIPTASDRLARIIEADHPGTTAIAIALSGASDPGDRSEFAGQLAERLKLSASKVHVETDSAITLRACTTESSQKIVLIAGTGSICIGSDMNGAEHKAGGWGPLIGDEGSGVAIGRDALRHLTMVLDKRHAPTALSDALIHSIGLQGRELEAYLKSRELKLASAARVVFETESKTSDAILDAAAYALAELVQAVLLRIATHAPRPEALFLSGSVAKSDAIRSRLKRHLPLMAKVPLEEDAPALALLAIAEML
jgi:N-acetylglucosamine kinase-like BadF-type ATPase